MTVMNASLRMLMAVSFLWAAATSNVADDISWLTNETDQLLVGCQLNSTAVPGTILFTPDAVNGYGAQWTRDFVSGK